MRARNYRVGTFRCVLEAAYRCLKMERQRLLALLEIYDTAIEELYVLGDRALVDLILRLERRRIRAAGQLGELDRLAEQNVWQAPAPQAAPARSQAAA
jgi:hypothetical protein